MTHHFSPGERPPLPTGWRRFMARLPIRVYRAGLGPLLGKRVLLLHHTGRLTGLRRQVVLEVVAHERDGNRLSWTIASGFGPAAAWYQNLRHSPRTTIQCGNRRYATTAHFLPPRTAAPSWPATPRSIRAWPADCAPSWDSRWTAAKPPTARRDSASRSSGSKRYRRPPYANRTGSRRGRAPPHPVSRSPLPDMPASTSPRAPLDNLCIMQRKHGEDERTI